MFYNLVFHWNNSDPGTYKRIFKHASNTHNALLCASRRLWDSSMMSILSLVSLTSSFFPELKFQSAIKKYFKQIITSFSTHFYIYGENTVYIVQQTQSWFIYTLKCTSIREVSLSNFDILLRALKCTIHVNVLVFYNLIWKPLTANHENFNLIVPHYSRYIYGDKNISWFLNSLPLCIFQH